MWLIPMAVFLGLLPKAIKPRAVLNLVKQSKPAANKGMEIFHRTEKVTLGWKK